MSNHPKHNNQGTVIPTKLETSQPDIIKISDDQLKQIAGGTMSSIITVGALAITVLAGLGGLTYLKARDEHISNKNRRQDELKYGRPQLR